MVSRLSRDLAYHSFGGGGTSLQGGSFLSNFGYGCGKRGRNPPYLGMAKALVTKAMYISHSR